MELRESVKEKKEKIVKYNNLLLWRMGKKMLKVTELEILNCRVGDDNV